MCPTQSGGKTVDSETSCESNASAALVSDIEQSNHHPSDTALHLDPTLAAPACAVNMVQPTTHSPRGAPSHQRHANTRSFAPDDKQYTADRSPYHSWISSVRHAISMGQLGSYLGGNAAARRYVIRIRSSSGATNPAMGNDNARTGGLARRLTYHWFGGIISCMKPRIPILSSLARRHHAPAAKVSGCPLKLIALQSDGLS